MFKDCMNLMAPTHYHCFDTVLSVAEESLHRGPFDRMTGLAGAQSWLALWLGASWSCFFSFFFKDILPP